MGSITAAYALGATVFPGFFTLALDAGGVSAAMTVLAASLVGIGLVSALVLAWTGARFVGTSWQMTAATIPRRKVMLLWLAYGAAVLAGLMTIGHAVGIARAQGLPPSLLVLAPMVVATCNMVGSLSGGWMADRISARRLLTGLPLLSALALMLMAFRVEPSVLAMLGVIGLVYGAVISAYPAVIARRFGVAMGVRIYGKVFTAWAIAGICGPVLAGAMFDATGGFTTALIIAASLGLVSSAIALRISL